MAFSDRLDSHPSTEVAAIDYGATHSGITANGGTAAATTATEPGELGQMEADAGDAVTEKRVSLPKPDINNITVLTESLPNKPILPWHRFNSPWLEKEETPIEALPEEEPAPPTPEDAGEQLTLALDQPSEAGVAPAQEDADGDDASPNLMP